MNKELVLLIRFQVDPFNMAELGEVLEKMNLTGDAQIVDMSVVTIPEPKDNAK